MTYRDEMSYDITPISVPVVLSGTKFTLREVSSDGGVKYQNFRLDCQIVEDGKVIDVKDLASLCPLLVSLCLYDDKTNTLVPQEVIRTWPERVVRELYQRAKEISGLEETDRPRLALEKALTRADAPISLSRLMEYVDTLDETYLPLQKWLHTAEESAKNLQRGTTAGSHSLAT